MAAPALTRPAGSPLSSSTPGSWYTDHPAGRHAEPACVSTRLNGVLFAEFVGAQAQLPAQPAEILLAALGTAVARTLGTGLLRLDVQTAAEPPARIAVLCDGHRGVPGEEAVAAARHALAAGTAPGTGSADIAFRYGGTGSPATVADGYALSVRLCEDAGAALDAEWEFDAVRFDRNTIEELADQFALALIEVTSG